MHAAVSVLAVFIVLTSSAVFLASESDASTLDSATYYKGQLTDGQKAIYEQFSALAEDPATDGSKYYYVFTVVSGSDPIEDAEKAWEALRLDDPYAFVTWRVSTDAPEIVTADSGSGNYTVTVYTDEAFKNVYSGGTVAKVKEAVEKISLSGSSAADRTKSVNSVLEGTTYEYSAEGVHCIYGILGDGTPKLSASGFSALFKALCDRTVSDVSVKCLQVYGTYRGDGNNVPYAWDLVSFDGQTCYACDPATSCTKHADAWLCAGDVSSYGGNAFINVHRAFEFNSATGLDYRFSSELLNYKGYEWPSSNDILTLLVAYMPWIIIGIICVILAGALVVMAKKGDI